MVDICRQQMETMRKRLRGQKLYHNNNNTEFIERYFLCYPIALYNNFKNVPNKIDKNVKISET